MAQAADHGVPLSHEGPADDGISYFAETECFTTACRASPFVPQSSKLCIKLDPLKRLVIVGDNIVPFVMELQKLQWLNGFSGSFLLSFVYLLVLGFYELFGQGLSIDFRKLSVVIIVNIIN